MQAILQKLRLCLGANSHERVTIQASVNVIESLTKDLEYSEQQCDKLSAKVALLEGQLTKTRTALAAVLES